MTAYHNRESVRQKYQSVFGVSGSKDMFLDIYLSGDESRVFGSTQLFIYSMNQRNTARSYIIFALNWQFE